MILQYEIVEILQTQFNSKKVLKLLILVYLRRFIVNKDSV